MNWKKIAPLVLPSVVVLLVWVGVVWVPTRGDLGQAVTRIEDAQQERVRLANRLDTIQTLPSLEARMQRRTRELGRAIPVRANLGNFLASVDSAALWNDVVVDNLAPTGITDNGSAPLNTRMPEGISSISIGLTVSGDYAHLLQFLEALEDMNRLVIVDAIDVFAAIEDSTVLSIIIELRIFTSGPISPYGVLDQSPVGGLAFENNGDVQSAAVESEEGQ